MGAVPFIVGRCGAQCKFQKGALSRHFAYNSARRDPRNRVPLVLTPQPEGGYTVTSPALPGLVTEGDSLEEALEHVEDALRATLELYEDTGRSVVI